jgi:transposase
LPRCPGPGPGVVSRPRSRTCCAWLTARTTATVVCALLRITWRSVSAVVDRVVADRAGKTDMLAGLRRIGIDEIAHGRGHRYLTCIVDHDTGRLVWAAPGRNSDTLKGFFDLLGEERSSQLTHVTADLRTRSGTVSASPAMVVVGRNGLGWHVTRPSSRITDRIVSSSK